MKKKEKFSQPWKEFAARWEKYYTLPGRPSREAIKIYKEYTKKAIKGIKNPRALVLGSTPELRDLLQEINIEVVFIDINLEMILAMSENMKHKNTDEIIVRGNWINTIFADNYFDVVMGDLVLANVPAESQNKFLKEVKRILKPKGYFLNKIFIIPDNWEHKSIDEIVEQYSTLPHYHSKAQELFNSAIPSVWNSKTGIVDVGLIRKGFNKYWKKGEYQHSNTSIEKALNDIWKMWKPMDKKWSVYKGTKTEKMMTQYFTVIKKIVLKDCKFRQDEMFPMWICKVKK